MVGLSSPIFVGMKAAHRIVQLGITGGMGVGKTTVCRVFQCLNIPVFDADQEAKALYERDEEVRHELIQLLGRDIYLGKKINKPLLASHIFSNPEIRHKINELIHPRVGQLSKTWFQQQKAPYGIKEAALLLESGAYKELDAIILVSAPMPWRLEQLKKRNPDWSMQEIQQRIDAQWQDKMRKPFCRFQIQNAGHEFLIPQILAIHHQILKQYVEAS